MKREIVKRPPRPRRGGQPKVATMPPAAKKKKPKDTRPWISVGIERGNRMAIRWPRHTSTCRYGDGGVASPNCIQAESPCLLGILTEQFTFCEESVIGNLTGAVTKIKGAMHKKVTPLNFTNAVTCLKFITAVINCTRSSADGRGIYRFEMGHDFAAWFKSEKAAAKLAQEAPLLLDYDPKTIHERWEDAESVLVSNPDGSIQYMVRFPDLDCCLFTWQAAALDTLIAMTRQGRGVILGDGTGVGKTYEAGAYLIRQKLRGIVVCPALLVEGWKRKFKEMCPKPEGPDTRVYVVGSRCPWGPMERVSRYQLIIISYDMLKKWGLFPLTSYVSGPSDEAINRELMGKLNTLPADSLNAQQVQRRNELTEAWNELTEAYEEAKAQQDEKRIALGLPLQSDHANLEIPMLTEEQRTEITGEFGVKLDQEDQRVLILDESHFAKSYNASRTADCLSLAQHAKVTLALSATPIKNRVEELHPVLRMTRRLWTEATLQEFRRMYEDEEARCEVAEHLHGFMIRRLVDDIDELRLPPKIGPEPVPVELENLTDYREVEADMIRWMIQNGYDDDAIARAEAGKIIVQINKLRKMAACGKRISSARIVDKELSTGEQCVVFCAFNDPLKDLARKFRSKTGRNYKGQKWKGTGLITGAVSMAKRQELIDDFQAGKIGLLCIGVTAGGMGIDLPISARGFFLDQPWTPADMEQCMGRLHRIGQERECHFVKLIASGADKRPTIDLWMEQILLTKAECIRDTLGDAEAIERIAPERTKMGEALVLRYAAAAREDPRFAADRANRI